MWLEEVVFKIRKPLTKAERKAFETLRNGGAAGLVGRPEITWSQEDLKWAEEKGMTEADLVSLIEQDRVDLEADSVREPGDSADLVSGQGKLLKWDTINNAYLSAVAELQGVQISLGTNKEPPFRGKSLKNVMEIRRTQADQLAREQFEDRGAGGVNSSYTDADFLRMQLALLKSSVAKPTVSCQPFFILFA
jgi:hypothetical protein